MRVVSARWSLATTIFFGLSICGLLCTAYIPVDAQQRSKVRRLGYLGSGAGIDDREEKLRDGLKELGYIEGQNLTIEWRFANGEEKRLPELAAELVRFKPDVIITTGTSPARALRDSTKMIPIVVASAGDLVGRKIVASLARPGGNITGFTSISPELNSKRLEILMEVVPRASRVAFLYQRHETDELKQLEIAAGTLSLHIQRHEVDRAGDFQNAYVTMARDRADAVLISRNPFTNSHRQELIELAAKNRLPTMCDGTEWTDSGCPISYGPDRTEGSYRAAVL